MSSKKSNQVKKASEHGAEMWWRWGRNGANDVQNETNLVRKSSEIVQIWGAEVEQRWCRGGAEVVQRWCRSGAEVKMVQ